MTFGTTIMIITTIFCNIMMYDIMMIILSILYPNSTNNHNHYHDVGDDFWHHPVPSPSWTNSDCSGHSSALPRRAEADPCTVRWRCCPWRKFVWIAQGVDIGGIEPTINGVSTKLGNLHI